MSKLTLTFACGLYDRMLPLYRGQVQPDGIDLNFVPMDGSGGAREMFDRMVGGLEFDASELSSTEFISRMVAGNCPFVAIPVFPSRVFRHGLITINRRSGIKTPKDLEGKRVGVALYQMTAATWLRGHLQHEYGVDLAKIRWVQGAINKGGAHGSPSVLPLLKPISIENNTTGRSLSELLEEGAIDAILGSALPQSIRRNPDIQRLFPNYQEVERDYYRRTRIFPIMHLVAIRRDVHEKHPFVATSLYKALSQSKARALEDMRDLGTLRFMLPWMTAAIDEIDEVFGGDAWPYGIEPNRPTLEALVAYMHEQAMIARTVAIEDLFVPVHGVF
jgi:4,5-dihydroxyphthalate decarboxylase